MEARGGRRGTDGREKEAEGVGENNSPPQAFCLTCVDAKEGLGGVPSLILAFPSVLDPGRALSSRTGQPSGTGSVGGWFSGRCRGSSRGRAAPSAGIPASSPLCQPPLALGVSFGWSLASRHRPFLGVELRGEGKGERAEREKGKKKLSHSNWPFSEKDPSPVIVRRKRS